MYWDRMDICEAHFCIEVDYNVRGILQERSSNQQRNMSTGFQLSRMKFKPPPTLTADRLSENGKKIYKALEVRYGFKSWYVDAWEESGVERLGPFTQEECEAEFHKQCDACSSMHIVPARDDARWIPKSLQP